MEVNEIPLWFMVFLFFLLGSAFGSFASAIAYRLPRKQSFITGRSACPSCGHALGALDLFPVLSWLWLRGRCRYCRVRYGVSYLLLEMCLGLSFAAAFLFFGLSLQTLLLSTLFFLVFLNLMLWMSARYVSWISVVMTVLAGVAVLAGIKDALL